ncbi:MAG: Gfo/Idh/MocA family oxidoreductase [Caldilineaceae bacterium]|nr:Gfo/Idh/MocA family oxidoreductase [Caldilineaceae bacterium]
MKLAFVGFRHAHMYAMYKHAQMLAAIEVVAACEEDAEARQQLAARGDIPITHDNLADMLATVDCEAVAVGEPYAQHGPLILQLLAQGKHVLVDKPVCITLSELAAIEQRLQETGLKLGCMLDMRDTPQVIGLRTLIGEGLIGEIHAISFGGQHPLLWDTRPAWYFAPGQHGGTLNDIAIHAIDAIPWITGLSFAQINAARSWNAFATAVPHFHDAGQLMVTMSNGCGVLGDVSYFMPDSMGYTLPHYWRMTFWGRKGVLESSATTDHLWVALASEQTPRQLALPAPNTAGYFHAFLRDIAGTSHPGELTTAGILAATRFTLQIQQVANQNLPASMLK